MSEKFSIGDRVTIKPRIELEQAIKDHFGSSISKEIYNDYLDLLAKHSGETHRIENIQRYGDECLIFLENYREIFGTKKFLDLYCYLADEIVNNSIPDLFGNTLYETNN